MGTTIDFGTNYSTVTTSKMRFTKGPGEVTEGAGVQVTDNVTFSGATSAPTAQAPASQTQRFSDLDPATRSSYKDTVKSLATGGRLYVRDDSGLRRADPMEIKERLDQGLPVEVVSRVASESEAHSSSSGSSNYKERGIFSEGWNIASSNSEGSRSERVFYASSPITEWDSLEFASAGQGVNGVAKLPASGGSVLVSSSYESDWSRRANEQWGFFTDKERSSSAQSHVRINHTAD